MKSKLKTFFPTIMVGLIFGSLKGIVAEFFIPEQTTGLSLENANTRFFISTSQPLLLTNPPSMIHPTSVSSAGMSSIESSTLKIKPTMTVLMSSEVQKMGSDKSPVKSSEKDIHEQDSVTEKLPDSITIKNQVSVSAEAVSDSVLDSVTNEPTKMSSVLEPITEQISASSSSSVSSIDSVTEADSKENEVHSETIEKTTKVSMLDGTSSKKSPTSESSNSSQKVMIEISASKTVASSDETTALPLMSTSTPNEPFLSHKVSRLSGASRPVELPRVAPNNIAKADLLVIEPSIIDDTKVKKNRQSDDESPLPGMNDIITGLLNVVGEGLSIATNFVKEENERKKEAALAKEKEASLLKAAAAASISAVPAFIPGRINNRGPPRYTEIPFEAIPLEILKSQKPGQNPVQIHQRPFHTRIKINKTQLPAPPFATGIPLPELLIPGLELSSSLNQDATSALRFPTKSIQTNEITKLQNRYTAPLLNPNGDDIDLKQIRPTQPAYTDVTIKATASKPFIGPQLPPNRPILPPRPINIKPVIETPPLGRPFLRPQIPITTTTGPSTTSTPSEEPEVLFVGQAFDIDPSRPPPQGRPEIFDLTVSVQQNFGGNQAPNKDGIITKASPGGDQFVSIDGKRTYFAIAPTHMPTFEHPRPIEEPDYTNALRPIQSPELGSGGVEEMQALPTINNPNFLEEPVSQPIMNRPDFVVRPIPTLRPQTPHVRIDTCIVGDESTCEIDKHEVCVTHLGVSTCDCRPGYGRKDYRKACRKTVRLMMSVQVDQIKQNRIAWNNKYLNPNSNEYITLEDEAVYAIDTAMAMTSFRNDFVSSEINKFFNLNGRVTVNATILLLENSFTSSVTVKKDIQRKIIDVIQARGNNIGNGNLFVDGRLNPIPGVADVNECSDPLLNDCDPTYARCINRFGNFECKCLPGYGDRFADNPEKSGRFCESCSADYCSGRGTCFIEDGDMKVCECKGNFYGKRCELDGEVVAVAVGASVAAVVIILLTTFCLCIWSRKWKREQRKSEIMRSFPPSYVSGGAPNPHLAATYMANLNKAAAYAAAAAASRHSMIGPSFGPQSNLGGTSVTSQEDLTVDNRVRLQQDAYGHNVYAQLYPLGTTSQFQAREFYHHTLPAPPPPPNHPPPPVPTQNEPIYAYPGSLYGTLPRGPPRPVKRPHLPLFDIEQALDEEIALDDAHQQKTSLTGSLINYATFRQNISNDAAIAAQKRAMINAKIARHWSNDDLTNLQRLPKSDDNESNVSTDEGNDADNSSELSEESSQKDESNSNDTERRRASPSPPPNRSRSRSSSPGKTVTFVDDQDERSLNELVSSPRRVINLKKLPLTKTLAEASTLFGGHKRKKRLAPSPPSASKSEREYTEEDDHDDDDEEEVLEHANKSHEALGAKLSASLRATFARNSQS